MIPYDETRDAISRTADLLERVGLFKGYFYNQVQNRCQGTPPTECSMCLIGAVNTVVLGHPDRRTDINSSVLPGMIQLELRDRVFRTIYMGLPKWAVAYARDRSLCSGDISLVALSHYSDSKIPNVTTEDVVSLLRQLV